MYAQTPSTLSELDNAPKPRSSPGQRRQDILRTLAQLLEDPTCDRATTAMIARYMGVCEAALYRSFKTKADMYHGLLDYMEQTLFDLFAKIQNDNERTWIQKAQTMVQVLLNFADKNRGLTRILTGQMLLKEDIRLTERVVQLTFNIEGRLRQTLREAALAGEVKADYNTHLRASLLIHYVMGRWSRFVLSGFEERPNLTDIRELESFFWEAQ